MDILFGMDVVGLHPVAVRTVGNKRVLSSKFGSGGLLVGAVPGHTSMELNANAIKLAQGTWDPPIEATISHAAAQVPQFIELQDLEPVPLASCRSCTKISEDCPMCSFRLTLEELESVQEMQRTMFHDEVNNQIRVSYPFKPEADDQESNYKQIKAIQENLERRVDKDGLRDAYNTEIQKMVEAGSVRKLTTEEMAAWRGG